MRILAPARYLLLAISSLLLSIALACGGDNGPPAGAGAHRVATYNERCPRCGAQWSVKIDEYASGSDTVEVVIENTGERGTLDLRLDKLAAIVFTGQQAMAWKEAYPAIYVQGSPESQLPSFGVRRLEMRATQGTAMPFTLRQGSTWRGRFELAPDVPAGTAGMVVLIGDIVHEQTPPGLIPTHSWITWDLNRPYIGLDGEVRVTPAAGQRP